MCCLSDGEVGPRVGRVWGTVVVTGRKGANNGCFIDVALTWHGGITVLVFCYFNKHVY